MQNPADSKLIEHVNFGHKSSSRSTKGSDLYQLAFEPLTTPPRFVPLRSAARPSQGRALCARRRSHGRQVFELDVASTSPRG